MTRRIHSLSKSPLKSLAKNSLTSPLGAPLRPLVLGCSIALVLGAVPRATAAQSGADPASRTAPAQEALTASSEVPTPASIIGWEPGADNKLADYGQIRSYFEALDAASDRLTLEMIGETAEGRPMMLAIISSEENLREWERYRAISERLARGLVADSAEAVALAAEGKVIVWVDGGLHATEVSGSQFTSKLAHRVVTEESAEMRKIREDVILLLMPVMNPDGLDIVANWYRQHLDTEFASARLPVLYQKYVGHDNNRDWFMIQQPESRAIANQLWHVWYPQIVLNHHQTAPFPARIFIPPFADPVNPHIPPLVVTGINLIGSTMHRRFAEEGKPGAVSRTGFTQWWNGGMRTAPYFHNQVGLLTEVAHNSATPREYDPATFPKEFRNGWSTERPSTWYPYPWEGGWWHLYDSVDYMVTASMATADVAADLKEEWLFNAWRMARQAIETGAEGGPYAYTVSLDEQNDASEAVELLEILRRGGVEVHRADAAFEADGRQHGAGTYVILASQSFRAYVMDLMEPQEYPDRRLYPGGPPAPPYDISGWTLPMQMGITVHRIEEPFMASLSPVEGIEIDPGRGGLVGEGDVALLAPGDNAGLRLVNRLLAGDGGGGVRVSRATTSFETAGRTWPAGTFSIRGRSTALDVLAREEGVELTAAPRPASTLELRRPRVGLYKSWVANMDEGWTRWVLEQYGFAYETLTDADVRGGDLARLDAIILPSQSPRSILHGHAPGRMPPEYVGGIGLEGTVELKAFVEGGGTLIAFDAASGLAIDQFGLPLTDVTAGVDRNALFIPGSLVRLDVDTADPLASGMVEEAAAFFSRSRAFSVDSGAEESGVVDVVARYSEEDLLMSGWEIGAQRYLAERPAVVKVALGDGQIVLFGFRPQFRGQPRATFKLIFNGLFEATAEE
jgi:hypothetical protein